MHTASGLIDEIPKGTTLSDAESRVLEYVTSHIPELQGSVGGLERVAVTACSPATCPTSTPMHSRQADALTIKDTCRWYRAYFNTGDGNHRALADIRESRRFATTGTPGIFRRRPTHPPPRNSAPRGNHGDAKRPETGPGSHR